MFRPPETRQQVLDRLAADVQANLPNTNPQKEESWLRGVLAGLAGTFFDLYFQISEAINTFFADTTYGQFLERKASNNGIFRNAATPSSGDISFTGTVSTLIPSGTLLNGVSNSVQYQTQTAKTIINDVLAVSLLTFSAGVATVTTTATHDLVNGISVTIAGASPAGLNGTFPVSAVIDGLIFEYETTEPGSGTATGTITVDVTRAIVDVLSQTAGEVTLLNTNEVMTLLTPIAGVDNNALVVFDGLGGGADEEDDASLKSRLIEKLQNPQTMFNAASLTSLLKTLAFVDRVFVFEITPATGQVTIYLLKEDNVLPNSTELQLATDLIEVTSLPANTAISDVFVLAPTPVVTAYTFTSISPDTATMRTSIENRLRDFYNNDTDIGEDITENEYICAIQSTIDLDTGETLDSFVLSTPSGDITIAAGEIGVLGTVTFP